VPTIDKGRGESERTIPFSFFRISHTLLTACRFSCRLRLQSPLKVMAGLGPGGVAGATTEPDD
jgi:hypothetical protein